MAKPCHNCRRRRLRCDYSVPSCNKCSQTGQECLGYGQLFRWVEKDTRHKSRSGSGSGSGSATPSRRGSRAASAVSPTEDSFANGCPEAKFHVASPNRTAESPISEPCQELTRRASNAVKPHPSLLDPIFQDLDAKDRNYLAYFSTRVCADLVAYDYGSNNPFRELIPLARQHDFLFHIVIATSAIHMSNLARNVDGCPCPLDPPPLSSGASTPEELDLHALVSGAAGPRDVERLLASSPDICRRAFVDALTSRQRALTLLNGALANIDSVGGDVVLAAVLFFINFDLIDDGPTGWKAHLHGAMRIMAHIVPDAVITSASLRDYVVSDCFIYYCLGSTFSVVDHTESPPSHLSYLVPVIERAATNSYLCCPPEILRILLAASQLAASADQPVTIDAAARLVHRARAFDVRAWSAALQRTAPVAPEVDASRVHVAEAHRAAACLYILQSVPAAAMVPAECHNGQVSDGAAVTPPPPTAETLVADIMAHLARVPAADPNFKATSWPTFVAGVESCDAACRTWAIRRLRDLWRLCPWGFLSTAVRTLEQVWAVRDEIVAGNQGHEGAGGVKPSWVQLLKGMDLNFVVV